jgi:hypothetical protein
MGILAAAIGGFPCSSPRRWTKTEAQFTIGVAPHCNPGGAVQFAGFRITIAWALEELSCMVIRSI